MISRIDDSVHALSHAAATTDVTPPPSMHKTFANRLEAAQASSFSDDDADTGGTASSAATAATTTAATLKPTGETLSPVSGHDYSSITSGVDKGMFLNTQSDNPRKGDAFHVVTRDGETFHVYGSGSSEVVEKIAGTTTSGGTTATG